MEDIKLTPFKQTRVYQEIQEEAAVNLIVRQLKKKFGQELSEETHAQIESLPLDTLHNLIEALLDFTCLDDLQPWLDAQISP